MEHRLEIELFMSDFENPDNSPVPNSENNESFPMKRLRVVKNSGPPEASSSGGSVQKQRPEYNSTTQFSKDPNEEIHPKKRELRYKEYLWKDEQTSNSHSNFIDDVETYLISHTHQWKRLLTRSKKDLEFDKKLNSKLLSTYHRLLEETEDEELKRALEQSILYIEKEISKGRIITSDMVRSMAQHIRKRFSPNDNSFIHFKSIKKGVIKNKGTLQA